MNSDLALWITLYVASGALIGGVITPMVTASKRFNDWLAMMLGAAVGAVTHLVGLVVLWLVLSRRKNLADRRPMWQRDAITLNEALAGVGGPAVPPRERAGAAVAALSANWWPARRADHEHSHRQAYIGVFLALAVITAIEVAITLIDLPISPVGPLVMLSTVKVLLVALYFMHLIYDSRWYAIMFISALPFSVLILAVLALS